MHLRASPPLPPNGNGAWWLFRGAGQDAGSGPGRLASGPGREAANATLVALWRGVTDKAPFPTPSSPFKIPSSPFILRGLCYIFEINFRVYVGMVSV